MASKVTARVASAEILLIVYLLLTTLAVTSVPFNFTLAILYPASGVNVTVADVPSLTVNDCVFPLIAVLLYVALPLPDAVIDNV